MMERNMAHTDQRSISRTRVKWVRAPSSHNTRKAARPTMPIVREEATAKTLPAPVNAAVVEVEVVVALAVGFNVVAAAFALPVAWIWPSEIWETGAAGLVVAEPVAWI